MLIVLRTHLPVKVQQLLEVLVLRRQHILDDGHHKGWLHILLAFLFIGQVSTGTRLGVAINRGDDDLAQRVDFDFIGALLEGRAEVVRRGVLGGVLEDDGVACRVR